MYYALKIRKVVDDEYVHVSIQVGTSTNLPNSFNFIDAGTIYLPVLAWEHMALALARGARRPLAMFFEEGKP